MDKLYDLINHLNDERLRLFNKENKTDTELVIFNDNQTLMNQLREIVE